MENLVWYNNPARYFEEAMPIGNGKIGAMVYGKTDVEKISLNEDSLWTGYPFADGDNENAYDNYKKMRREFEQGNVKEAESILEKGFVGNQVQSYLPAGNLFIKMNDNNVCDYKRSLNFEHGETVIGYNADECRVEERTFVSAVDNVLVHTIETTRKHDFEIWLESSLKNSTAVNGDCLILSGQAPDRDQTKAQDYTYDRTDTIKYTIAVKADTDGSCEVKNGVISVKNSTSTVVFLSIKTSYVAWNKIPDREHLKEAQKTVADASKKGEKNVRNDHIRDFSSYYNRVKLNIDHEPIDLPTDERITASRKDVGMFELLFNFGRYLLISSSRSGSLATNLQGIWNEKLIAPWSSDYTVNINTEMNYWPVLICNLAELAEPLTELMRMISESGKKTAKQYYYVDKGFAGHHNFDIWGKTSPAPGSSRWSYWCMGCGWLCRHLYEYYQYSGDIKFLEETAFPIMYEAARFYMGIAEEHDGKLIITPSTSPEHAYKCDGETRFLAKYTTMTQAILMDLFGNLIKACDILGKTELKEELESKYSPEKFDVYRIGSLGQLLEYDDEYEDEDIHHRHVSHLYGLFPGDSIKSEELINACKKSLEIRGDNGTGWSIGWKVNLWAKLKDGNRALSIVHNQLKFVPAEAEMGYLAGGGTYANMFDAHPPFQIDGNFGVTSGIALMLLQSEDGIIEILPALPDEFESGSAEGLKAVGNVTVSVWWRNHKAERIRLVSPKKQRIKVSVGKGEAFTADLDENTVWEKSFDID